MENRNLLSVPAMILESSQPMTFEVKELNKFVSLVKLKVFYQGTTPDNREFTEKFSNKVLASLPQTPVVAYHDGDDFIGHNDEQYVYGYVPEVGEIGFEEIDGQKWAVTDIILFTGRDDNIGEVASKIFNKQHSLELSENTSYKVVKDDSGRSKLVFTDTEGVIGLSVLGDHQEPGFTGSEFFTENKSTLESLIKQYAQIKEQELLPLNFTESLKSGGAVMDLKQTIAHLNDFMKATFDEIYQDVQRALIQINDWFYVVAIDEKTVVYIDFEDGTYYRASYERAEDGQVEFGAAEIVKARFLTDEEIDEIFSKKETEKFEDGEDGEDGEDAEDAEDAENDESEDEEDGEDGEDNDEDDVDVDVDDVTPTKRRKRKKETQAEVIETEVEVIETEVEVIVPQFSPQELEQLEKDMAELEAYRLKDKEAVLNSFEKYLTEEEKQTFAEGLKDYSVDTLEQALSVIAMKKIREAKDVEEFSSVIGIQSILNHKTKNKSEQDRLARLVAENK